MNNRKLVYHYTTLDALCSLLNDMEVKQEDDEKQGYHFKFRASNTQYLNDPTENKLYKSAIKDAIKDAIKNPNINDFISSYESQIGNSYALSFSESGDDLNMWRLYADNAKGVVLSFDKEELNEYASCKEYQFGKCEYHAKNNLIKWIKQNDNWEAIVHDVSNAIPSPTRIINNIDFTEDPKFRINNLVRDLYKNSLFKKHIAYQSEKEMRLVVSHLDEKYRARKGNIISYYEILIPLTFLKEIMLGPCVNIKNKTVVEKMLHNKGLKINIKKSKIPYSG